MVMATCAHCGGPRQGYGGIGGNVVCHPDNPSLFPDCFRRVTVYAERLGALRDVRPLPHGVIGAKPYDPWTEMAQSGLEINVASGPS